MRKLNFLVALFVIVLFYSCSDDDNNRTTAEPTFEKVATNLPKLAFHQSVVFEGKIWVIGGVTRLTNGQEVYTNGIYSSNDGVTFTNHGNGPFSERGYHQVQVLNNKIWLFGGVNASPTSTTVYDDVWSSSDGINWVQETLLGSHFGPRYGHKMITFDDKIWCIGGANQTNALQGDIWFSYDGLTWNLYATPSNYFNERYLHSLTVFNGEMTLIGGNTNMGRKHDIWKGNTGHTWTQVITSGTIFSDREAHESIVKDDKLYVIGGSADNEVWESLNGVDWTNSFTINDTANNLVGHTLLVFNDKILVVGGVFDANNYSSDIYTSNF